jgi:perosamine synthetase
MKLRYIAPAGAPVPLSALLSSIAAWIGRENAGHRLEQRLQTLLGVQSCVMVSTGRAGLTVLLRSLQRLSDTTRDEVLIPSYTCYSVAGSIMKAGLNVRLADIDPATLDFDYDRLRRSDMRRVLAVVATNLYGLPNDMLRLIDIARDRGSFVVDDAAQALGARVAGRWCGTLGDAGILSFDKGKNLSAIDGGAIVTDSRRIADVVAADTNRLPAPSVADQTHALIKAAAYVTLLPPRLYWIPNSIPALGLGKTVYTTDYPVTRHPRWLSALALTMLARLSAYTAQRRANAERMRAAMSDVDSVETITPAAGTEPAYLRLPVLLRHREMRDAAVVALDRAGIGATGSYPTSIADVPALAGKIRGDDRDAAGGRDVANRIMTLPTHPFVTEHDCAAAVGVLRRVIDKRTYIGVETKVRPAASIR